MIAAYENEVSAFRHGPAVVVQLGDDTENRITKENCADGGVASSLYDLKGGLIGLRPQRSRWF